MPPSNYKRNQYEFKEEYVVLRIFSKDAEYKVFIDYEDYPNVSKHSWYMVNWATGLRPYVIGRESRKKVSLHRFILNPSCEMQVDHINHNPLDNRRDNLRVCSQQENLKNRRTKRGYGIIDIPNISIAKTKYKDEVYSYYRVNKKGFPIKTFKTLELAMEYKRKLDEISQKEDSKGRSRV